MSDAYVMSDPTTGKRYAVCGSAKVEIDPLVFDAMIGAFGGETDRLKAENIRLREERDHWHVEQVHAYGNWEDAHKRAVELEAENARLRELAGFMIRCMQKNHDCIDCLVNSELCELSYIESDARELGVEVPV